MINICPFLANSLFMAFFIKILSNLHINVFIVFLSIGGVWIKLKSLIPNNDLCKVLGIGVALNVSKCRLFLYFYKTFSIYAIYV